MWGVGSHTMAGYNYNGMDVGVGSHTMAGYDYNGMDVGSGVTHNGWLWLQVALFRNIFWERFSETSRGPSENQTIFNISFVI